MGSSPADLQGPAGNTYDKYGTGNPVSRLVVRRFLSRLDEVVRRVNPREILDVGCGEGVVTQRLAALVPDAPVVGVDVDDPTLAAEWERRRGDNLTFAAGTVYRLPHDDDAFDLVSAVEMFEHLERPEEALIEVTRVARRSVIITTPREPLWRIANVASGRHLRTLGDTPGHINHWSRRALVRFASQAGRVTEVHSPLPWTIVRIEITDRPTRSGA